MTDTILVINCGSSSVKFAVFRAQENEPERRYSGALQRIGRTDGRVLVKDEEGTAVTDETVAIPDYHAALDLLLNWVSKLDTRGGLLAVGHRVAHGGEGCDCPRTVSPELEARLEKLTPLAPLHLPHNLAGIRAVRHRLPNVPQIACFDTAFHQTLPRVARMTGLPHKYSEDGILRYGFHGLSYEYVVEDIRRRDGEDAAQARIIVAHLGNGASMTAIMGTRSVETTMGFSTLSGLPMGTRCGDLDPGILLYLLSQGSTQGELQNILYSKSGLLGISGISHDMADLLARRDTPKAAEAIDYFCYHVRNHLAGLTAALGGLDRVVFTGGIGANAPEIRAAIVHGLDYLGLRLNSARNAGNRNVISEDDGPVPIEVVVTDEELVIARYVGEILMARAASKKEQAHV